MLSDSSDEERNYTNLAPLKGMAFQQYRMEKMKTLNKEEGRDNNGEIPQEEEVEECDTVPKETKKKGKGTRGKAKAAKSTSEKEKKPDKKDWSDDELVTFIEMLEDNPCLWDIFHSDYSKRDIKEIAYSTIADVFETNINSVKAKINGLRAQLGREKAKETKTKSGQGTDELYESTWVHYKQLSFLLPVIGGSKSKETIRKKRTIGSENVDVDDGDETPVPKKQTMAEKKLDLLAKCTEAISKKKSDNQESKVSNFALYIEEKLNSFDKRKRTIAEKRISDIIFEIEMSSEIPMNPAVNFPVTPTVQNFQNQSTPYNSSSASAGYLSMLQS